MEVQPASTCYLPLGSNDLHVDLLLAKIRAGPTLLQSDSFTASQLIKARGSKTYLIGFIKDASPQPPNYASGST